MESLKARPPDVEYPNNVQAGLFPARSETTSILARISHERDFTFRLLEVRRLSRHRRCRSRVIDEVKFIGIIHVYETAREKGTENGGRTK